METIFTKTESVDKHTAKSWLSQGLATLAPNYARAMLLKLNWTLEYQDLL
jgi:hypothetical protein